MARDERWREERRWDFDRERRNMQARPDYGQADFSDGPRYAYRDYRREDLQARDEDLYRYEGERYRSETEGSGGYDDDRAYRPFGATGPTAYYAEEERGWSGRDYDPYPRQGRSFEDRGREVYQAQQRYTPNPREGRGEEPRSWLDKAGDEVASWFGDHDAARRRHWDEMRSDMRAEHRGRGPKGYRRSDDRIREDVNDRLTDDPYLDATEIEVSVKDGEVTLSGYVFHREDKRRAERLAEDVAGVDNVQNNIRQRRDYDVTSTGRPVAGNF